MRTDYTVQEIPYPLRKTIALDSATPKVITIPINFDKLRRQMSNWAWNNRDTYPEKIDTSCE